MFKNEGGGSTAVYKTYKKTDVFIREDVPYSKHNFTCFYLIYWIKVELIKNGGNDLAIQCFADHPGQPLEVQSQN